ncbi:nicotinate-nucleotide adenylyltransferase [soil metagenome]
MPGNIPTVALPPGVPHDPVTSVTAERVGLFGGTFDPPHVGHLVAAVNVRHALRLDRLLLLVANEPWQKIGQRPISVAADRLAMVRAAVRSVPALEASDREIRRGGPSYSADTLEELAAEDPARELFLVVGSDAAAGLPTWERVDAVRELATVVVVERPGSVEGPLPAGFRWRHVEAPRLDVSSTDLRARITDGRPLDYLLPPEVISCIAERRLYREAR